MKLLTATIAALLSASSNLNAQSLPHPTAKECEAAASSLAQGSDSSGWERLVDCGEMAGPAFAKAIIAAGSQTDVSYLGRLYSAVARVRHPAIFNSALEVMKDPAASGPARATAILMALSQHEPGWGLPPSVSYSQAVTSKGSASCRMVRFQKQLYRSSTPLPASYLQQLAHATEQLSTSSSPPSVQALARCAHQVVVQEVGEDVSKLDLVYLCGNRFRARNQSQEWVHVSYDVPGTHDRGDLTIPPGGETTFTTEKRGATRLNYRGKPIKTAPNSGASCSS